jgi:hypothetical protein
MLRPPLQNYFRKTAFATEILRRQMAKGAEAQISGSDAAWTDGSPRSKATTTRACEQYAQSIALARQAFSFLNQEGPVVAGRANPWLVVLETAHQSSVALGARTASSRCDHSPL